MQYLSRKWRHQQIQPWWSFSVSSVKPCLFSWCTNTCRERWGRGNERISGEVFWICKLHKWEILLLTSRHNQVSCFSSIFSHSFIVTWGDSCLLSLLLPTRKCPVLCMPHNWQRLLFIINYNLSISTYINISNTTNRNIKPLVTSASYTSSQSATNHTHPSSSMFESVP